MKAWLTGLALLALGCGDDGSTTSGGGGGSTSGVTSASGATSATTSTATSTATGATTGSASSTTGAGGGCPDLSCTDLCPNGTWVGLDGCDTCACAPPPLSLSVDGFTKPVAFVSLDVVASELIGGIDRWVFDFTWTYDDPMTSDDAEVVEATVRIMRTDPMFEPSEASVTWFSPEDDGNPIESLGGMYTLYGFAIINDTLTPLNGFLSIRVNGADFEGGVLLDLQGAGQAGLVHATGPFKVAMP